VTLKKPKVKNVTTMTGNATQDCVALLPILAFGATPAKTAKEVSLAKDNTVF